MAKQTTPKSLKPTSLDEIREQAKPTVISIPGFRPGTTINVAVQPVDLTPHILELGLGNPVLAAAIGAAANSGGDPEAATKAASDAATKAGGEASLKQLAPLFDAVAQEALVEPTYDQIIEAAGRPLTLDQKLAIFDAATGGGFQELRSFRGQ